MTDMQISNDERTSRLKLTWGLVCLILPTALFLIALMGYATLNFVYYSNVPQPSPDEDAKLFGDQPVGISIANVILFLLGTVSVLTWLPGIITGIILLATRKRHASN